MNNGIDERTELIGHMQSEFTQGQRLMKHTAFKEGDQMENLKSKCTSVEVKTACVGLSVFGKTVEDCHKEALKIKEKRIAKMRETLLHHTRTKVQRIGRRKIARQNDRKSQNRKKETMTFTHGKGNLEYQSSVKRVGPGQSTASRSQSQSHNEKINFDRGSDPKEKAQERPAPGK